MDTEVDLTTVDRAVLIAIIAELQAVIERLQRRIAELEGQAKPGGPLRMPGLKAKSGRKPPAQQGPRKQRRHGFARPRMTPTDRVEHVMENCPDCGAHRSGGWIQRTREVIELPVVPAQVTEHVYIARTCPACRRRCTPPAELGGVVLGQQRLGVNLLSLIATLREEGRLPIRSVHPAEAPSGQRPQEGQPEGAVLAGVVSGHRASVAPQRGGHRERHPSHGAAGPTGSGRDPGPHPRQPSGPRRRNRLASERGQRLRVDFQHPGTGANGTLLPAAGYFLRRGRGKTVVDEALSDAFSGVLVSDFYAAYHHYDGPKQRCWAHLLRDIHDLRTRYPDAAPLARWADAVHGIYDRAKACTHPQAKRRRTAQLALERQLLALGQPFRHDPSATQAKLCRRIERHIKELFVFVAEPDVPSDNNAAERSLRHLVISRKISGGTRSEQGTESKMTLASIFGTWRAQGLNPLAACRQLLVSPLL